MKITSIDLINVANPSNICMRFVTIKHKFDFYFHNHKSKLFLQKDIFTFVIPDEYADRFTIPLTDDRNSLVEFSLTATALQEEEFILRVYYVTNRPSSSIFESL